MPNKDPYIEANPNTIKATFNICSGKCASCGLNAEECSAYHAETHKMLKKLTDNLMRQPHFDFEGFSGIKISKPEKIIYCHECRYYRHSHKTSNGVEFNFCNRPGEGAVLREPHDFCSRGRRKNDT